MLFFLSVLAMASATGAWAQTATLSLAVNNTQMGTVHLDDTAGRTIFGDVVNFFSATSSHQYGVCADGTNVYTSSWSTSVADGFMFHQYNANGDSLDAFSIPGVLPIRDLTSDAPISMAVRTGTPSMSSTLPHGPGLIPSIARMRQYDIFRMTLSTTVSGWATGRRYHFMAVMAARYRTVPA